ncbi:MAG: invasion associated locus B family protein [Granulosicoccus sp.]
MISFRQRCSSTTVRPVHSLAGAAAVTLGMILSSAALAQSTGGLKLGQPEEQAPVETLDLGAPAPADRSSETAPATAPQAAPAAGNQKNLVEVQRNTVGAWDVACPPEGSNCAMAQIGNDASGTPVLEMVIRKLEEPLEVGERTAIAVLDVITPLGVVLTEGLSVTIDNGKPETAPFQICTEQGCLVREPIDDSLVSRLKRGNSAVVSVIAANQGEVKATLSLSGFTKAYNGLK